MLRGDAWCRGSGRAERQQADLDATVVVENKPGAASLLGAGQAARAIADGYTLLMTTSTTLARVVAPSGVPRPIVERLAEQIDHLTSDPSTRDRLPSTVPGCRTPHLWDADGVSLYDRMGPEFTLLRFDPAADAVPLVRAAEERKLPLKMPDIAAPPEVAREASLLLSRPDQHVAWRGNSAPVDSLALIDRLRGAS